MVQGRPLLDTCGMCGFGPKSRVFCAMLILHVSLSSGALEGEHARGGGGGAFRSTTQVRPRSPSMIHVLQLGLPSGVSVFAMYPNDHQLGVAEAQMCPSTLYVRQSKHTKNVHTLCLGSV